jgi:hypothetical protein
MSTISELIEVTLAPLPGNVEGEREIQSALEAIDFSKKDALPRLLECVERIHNNLGISDVIARVAADTLRLANEWNDVFINTGKVNQGLVEGRDLALMLSIVDAIAVGKRKEICEKASLLIINSMSVLERAMILAKCSARIAPLETMENIQKFGITDQEALQKIALIIAQQSGNSLAKHIQNFGIANESIRIEIAKVCARDSPRSTAENIQEFGITNPEALQEIAFLIAKRVNNSLAEHIQKFAIAEESIRIEIAKVCARVSPDTTAENIQNFDIKNLEALQEIALIIASQDTNRLAQHIKKFDIRDPAILTKIALICARVSPYKTAEYIQEFDITNPEANPEALKEIAFLIAEQVDNSLAEHIQKFAIAKESIRIEIAKVCARVSPNNTARNIHNFGIKNQDALIEIAKSVMQETPYAVAQYIQNFGIKDEDTRIEIAKDCAISAANTTATNIRNFGITNPKAKALKEIALIIASQNNNCLARYIANFDIEDQDALYEIASLCAKTSPLILATELGNFGIEASDRRSEIYSLCMIHDPFSIAKISLYQPEIFDKLPDLISMDTDTNWDQNKALDFLKEFIRNLMGDENTAAKWVDSTLKQAKDAYTRRQLTVSIAAAFCILRLQLDVNQFTYAFQTGLIQAVYKTRSPHHYLPLINEVALFSRDEIATTRFLNTLPSKLEGYTDTAVLIRMLLSRIKDDPAPFVQFVQDSYLLFKDAPKMRLLLSVLYHLSCETTLDQTQKEAILAKIKDAGDVAGDRKHKNEAIVKILRQLEIIFDLGKGSFLTVYDNRVEEASNYDNRVEEASNAAIQATFPIEGRIEDPASRVHDTFGSSHNPTAIWQYVAKMKQLNDPRVMECLSLFIHSVLDNTFPEVRYDVALNPHLKQLSHEILVQWRQPLVEVTTGDFRIIDTDEPNHILLCGSDVADSCQRVDGDPKLNKGLLGYLMNGQTRLLAVVDKKGRIVARCMIRLLFDDQGNPALFQENLYGDRKYTGRIEECAKAKARAMNLPLMVLAPWGVLPTLLRSIGGRSPYEFSDGAAGAGGAGGVQVNSQFTIKALPMNGGA